MFFVFLELLFDSWMKSSNDFESESNSRIRSSDQSVHFKIQIVVVTELLHVIDMKDGVEP